MQKYGELFVFCAVFLKNITFVKKIKQLGQHFLHNNQIAADIVRALPIMDSTQKVFEIGPGEGVLTQYLVQRADVDLHLVELDARLPQLLRQKFPILRDRIIEQDVLHVRFDQFASEQFAIIGNFPYNISSQIMFKILDYKDQVRCMVGMFQKEVAERIVSPPNSKEYGILSVLLQAYYSGEYLFTVAPHEFDPPPKVQSAVIRLVRNGQYDGLIKNERYFKTVVKTAFNQRRKKLSNALGALSFDTSQFPVAWLDRRAEQLGVAEFIQLANAWQPN